MIDAEAVNYLVGRLENLSTSVGSLVKVQANLVYLLAKKFFPEEKEMLEKFFIQKKNEFK